MEPSCVSSKVSARSKYSFLSPNNSNNLASSIYLQRRTDLSVGATSTVLNVGSSPFPSGIRNTLSLESVSMTYLDNKIIECIISRRGNKDYANRQNHGLLNRLRHNQWNDTQRLFAARPIVRARKSETAGGWSGDRNRRTTTTLSWFVPGVIASCGHAMAWSGVTPQARPNKLPQQEL